MKIMRINRDSEEVCELLGLVYSSPKQGKMDINSDQVTKSAFYKTIQQAIDLDATRLFFSINEPAEEVMLLLARIAATSPTLRTVCLNENHFGKYGPAVAVAFASALAIKKVSMDSCIFDQNGCAETITVFKEHNQNIIKTYLSNLVEAVGAVLPTPFIELIAQYDDYPISHLIEHDIHEYHPLDYF